MGIQNFPTALQPIIQQGFLAREFQAAISCRLGFRMCADRETTSDALLNYGPASPLYTVTSRVGIASQFLLNAAINGEQAAAKIASLAGTALRSVATPIDGGSALTMALLLNAVAQLRQNAVPEIDGAYNCYLDPVSARQLFSDPVFRQLFQGATSANQVFKHGMVNDFLGLRFIPVNGDDGARRTFVCGRGALVERVPEDLTQVSEINLDNALLDVIDGALMITFPPIDRLQQIIAQSWAYMGDFTARPERFVTIETRGIAA